MAFVGMRSHHGTDGGLLPRHHEFLLGNDIAARNYSLFSLLLFFASLHRSLIRYLMCVRRTEGKHREKWFTGSPIAYVSSVYTTVWVCHSAIATVTACLHCSELLYTAGSGPELDRTWIWSGPNQNQSQMGEPSGSAAVDGRMTGFGCFSSCFGQTR